MRLFNENSLTAEVESLAGWGLIWPGPPPWSKHLRGLYSSHIPDITKGAAARREPKLHALQAHWATGVNARNSIWPQPTEMRIYTCPDPSYNSLDKCNTVCSRVAFVAAAT